MKRFQNNFPDLEAYSDAKIRAEEAVTISLSLPPDAEIDLLDEARDRGLPVETIVRERVLAGRAKKKFDDDLDEISTEEYMHRVKEWAEGHRDWPILSDEAMSRESIYEDRGL